MKIIEQSEEEAYQNKKPEISKENNAKCCQDSEWGQKIVHWIWQCEAIQRRFSVADRVKARL